MTVADVGANVGLYTLLAARLLQGRGRVFSFEPTPAIFHLLRENVRLNGFAECGVVHLYDLALSDRAGDAVLYTDRKDSTHNSLFPESSQTEEIRIRTARLDDILGPDISLDFVKIDAEGSDPLVLHGMGRLIRNNPQLNIIMEFAPAHIDRAGRSPGDVIDEIMSAGFLIQVIDPVTGDLAPARREALVSRENTDVFLARNAS
jgi:FkbM family methyltransferase